MAQSQTRRFAQRLSEAAALRDSNEAWESNCESERNEAYAAIKGNQEEYDKQLLTLSAGFIAVVISFINNIVPLKDAKYLGCLYSSLIVMCGCLLSVLASYQVSIHVQYQVADYWAKRKDQKCSPKFPMRGANIVRGLNIADGILFAIGILLSVAFVVVNIHIRAKELSQMINPQHIREGANIKMPSDVVEKGQNIKIPSDHNRPVTPPPPSTNQSGTGQATPNSVQKKP